MRVFYSSLIQETNTFCPNKTDISVFERGYLLRGEEIADQLRETNTEIGGIYEYFDGKPIELLGGVASWGVAYGRFRDADYQSLTGDILQSLRDSLPVDGVLLALHGALVAESIDDCEGDLIRRTREIVGPKVPIVVSLDYHANVTREMVTQADVLVGYRTYPHVDFAKTGCRAAKILDHLIHGAARPVPVFHKLPLIVPVEDSETNRGVSGYVIGELEKLDGAEDLISASLFCSHPWLDIAEVGVSLLFYVNRESLPLWKERAEKLADYIFQHREEFFKNYPSMEEAAASLESYQKPVIFVDSGDITTAGGLGDSTQALRVLRNCPAKSAISIVSAKAVSQAFQMGTGAEGLITIGGDSDYGYNQDIEVRAQVVRLSDHLSKVTGEAFSGVEVDTGRRAYLLVDGHIHIVAAEYASMMYDPQFLRDMGIEPAEMDVIIQKSHKLFRPAYAGIAKQVVLLDTPGFTDKNLRRHNFTHVPHPIYPLDAQTTFSPAPIDVGR